MRWLIAAACGLAALAGMQAPVAVGDISTPAAITSAGGAGTGQSGEEGTKPDATATLEQCLTALVQSERSATFVGEMTAVPGTARMEISIGLLERVSSEAQYRSVNASGLGAWRGSAPSVKTYTYIKQVTNLSAPAFYRGVVRFRWLNAKGHLIKAQEMRTPRCEQPAASSSTGSEEPGSSSAPPSAPATTTPSG